MSLGWIIKAYDFGARSTFVQDRHGNWTGNWQEGGGITKALHFPSRFDAEEWLIQRLISDPNPIWEEAEIVKLKD